MNQRKLQIFYEVATQLNMTAAAEKLYISQPAISQTIRELETEFEVKFFDRIGKKLYLTGEGELFLHYTRRILNLYTECYQSIHDINGLKKGKLNVGASPTIGIYMLPELVGKFQKAHPEIEVAIHIEKTRTIANLILDNQIDFAFVEGAVYSEEICVENFWEDELVFIVAPEHPWNRQALVGINDLEKEKFIMREPGSGNRETLENAFLACGVSYRLGMELGNSEAIKKVVEAGLGVSCISKRCIKQELENNQLKVVSIGGMKIQRSLTLIYHKDKYLSQLLKHFIDFCRQVEL